MSLIASISAARGDRADEDAADELRPRAVPVQVEPVGVAGVDEQLVGREAHEHVRVARVDADVAPAGLLRPQRVDDARAGRRRSGRTTSRPQPRSRTTSAPHALRAGAARARFHDRLVMRRRRRDGGAAPVPGDAGRPVIAQTPWVCSQSSSRPSCQSLLPCSGVSSPFGSASSSRDVLGPEQAPLAGGVAGQRRPGPGRAPCPRGG